MTHEEHLLGGLDLLLPGEEDEDVAQRLGDVDLQHGHHHGVEVVRLRRLRVVDVDRVAPTGDTEHWRIVKELEQA